MLFPPVLTRRCYSDYLPCACLVSAAGLPRDNKTHSAHYRALPRAPLPLSVPSGLYSCPASLPWDGATDKDWGPATTAWCQCFSLTQTPSEPGHRWDQKQQPRAKKTKQVLAIWDNMAPWFNSTAFQPRSNLIMTDFFPFALTWEKVKQSTELNVAIEDFFKLMVAMLALEATCRTNMPVHEKFSVCQMSLSDSSLCSIH